MTNSVVLGLVLFFLLVTGYLTTIYDRDLCPNTQEWVNTTLNVSQRSDSWTDYIWNSRCDGLPDWYKLLIYTPFVAIGLRSLYP